jgi:small-conductance mechanosensitive channel
VFGQVLAKTSLFFIFMVALKLVVGQAEDPPEIIGRSVNILFIIAAAVQAAVWGRELILGVLQNRFGEEDPRSTLGSAIGIIRLLVTVALFAIAIIVILDNLGVNVTGLVAGLGIGGIAIGLAAQGIFSDLFASLSIIFDRPFRRGDAITFGTTTGTVEHIGLKSTRIRSLNGEEVVISNTKLLEQQVQNWALLQRRRAVMLLQVTHSTPPELLARLPEEIGAIVSVQDKVELDRVHLSAFTPNSIDIELVWHFASDDFVAFMDAKQAIMLGILHRFAALGVRFAHPVTVNYTAAPDGSLINPCMPA